MIHPARFLTKLSQSSALALLAMTCSAALAPQAMSRLAAAGDVPANGRPAQPVQRTAAPRNQAESPESAVGVVRLAKKSPDSRRPVQQPTNRVTQVSHSQVDDPNCPPFTITECPPTPRWGAPGPNPFAQGMLGCRCETTALAEKFPDEYLCDGGDRSVPVHYDSNMRDGLDTEDTVAEYTDHAGKEHVRPTNRVCLYAPRVSTVRTISRPHEGMTLDEVAGVGHAAGSNQYHTRLKLGNHTKNQMTGGVLVRSRASGLESEQIQGNISQAKRLAIHDKLLNVYQDLTFVQFGKLETADAARLNYGIQASLVWSRELYPVIAAKTDAAMTGTYEAHVATIVGIDDKGSDKPGDLRVVKLADKDTAQPGDIVEFTIRYDNRGPNTVHHVRIADNLTPRLAYVEDSATSDREGRLVVQDNSEGSLVLVWELTQPLPAHTGGVVSFKARVR
jgi:uncharacterized repeat protein (TIGR01451 family)